VPDATFATPDLSTFCRLDELGLEVTGQRLGPDRAALACRVVDGDEADQVERFVAERPKQPYVFASHMVIPRAEPGRRMCIRVGRWRAVRAMTYMVIRNPGESE